MSEATLEELRAELLEQARSFAAAAARALDAGAGEHEVLTIVMQAMTEQREKHEAS